MDQKAEREKIKIMIMRQAQTQANEKYSIGGIVKEKGYQPRKITLPRLKCLSNPEKE